MKSSSWVKIQFHETFQRRDGKFRQNEFRLSVVFCRNCEFYQNITFSNNVRIKIFFLYRVTFNEIILVWLTTDLRFYIGTLDCQMQI